MYLSSGIRIEIAAVAALLRNDMSGDFLINTSHEAAHCHSDRGDAQHHVVEESGSERKNLHNCRPDSSTSLGMTDAEVGSRCLETHVRLAEEQAVVSCGRERRSGRVAATE